MSENIEFGNDTYADWSQVDDNGRITLEIADEDGNVAQLGLTRDQLRELAFGILRTLTA